MYILVTGGLGYIGSHIVVELLQKNYEVIIIDNLLNSKIEVFERIKKICKSKIDNLVFYKKDLLNKDEIEHVFRNYLVNWVIHCAGLKSVEESLSKPINYYKTNLNILLNLIEIMELFNTKNLIFSSSATLYGNQKSPIIEDMLIGQNISNPYGETKYMQEKILIDLCKSDKDWKIVSLRYFNPVGAHESGLIGDDPDIANNLMPHIVRVANRTYKQLNIFGNDYNTPDKTCLRDFIHVVDLAIGHIKVIDKIKNNGYQSFNLGTGNPISVLELISAFEKVNNIKINKNFTNRRDGDLEKIYADSSKANKLLNWTPNKSIDDMVRDSWNFAIQ